jgi:hypothetical protein
LPSVLLLLEDPLRKWCLPWSWIRISRIVLGWWWRILWSRMAAFLRLLIDGLILILLELGLVLKLLVLLIRGTQKLYACAALGMLSIIAVVCVDSLKRPRVSIVSLRRLWLLWICRLFALVFRRNWRPLVLLRWWVLVICVLLRFLVFFTVCAQ